MSLTKPLVRKHLFAQPKLTLTEEEVIVEFPNMLIPADLTLINHATYCNIAIKVALFDLKNNKFLVQDVQSFEIERQPKPFSVEAQKFTFKGSPSALCVVYLSLFYTERTFAGNAILNNQQMSPAAILRAEFSPGEADTRDGWSEMLFNAKKKRKNLK